MRRPVRLWRRILPLHLSLALTLLTACRRERADGAVHILSGSTPERVELMSRMLQAPDSIEATIRDAQFIEERIGDGNLGPSDFQAYYAISIDPVLITRWTAVLPALPADAMPASHVAPRSAPEWWVRDSDFSRLRFFSPASVTSRRTGWIGVDSANAMLYIYTFTQ